MGERRKAGGGNPERGNGYGAGRGHLQEQEPVGFAAVRVDGGEGEKGESGEFIKPEEILYAFTAGAVRIDAAGRRVLAVVAKWVAKLCFPSGIVFLRTRKGIYRTYVRTLREFKRNVAGRRFEPVSRSVVANLEAVRSVDLGRQRVKTLSYAVEESELSWALELVTVSRKYLPRIRECFAMPRRLSTSPSRTSPTSSPPPGRGRPIAAACRPDPAKTFVSAGGSQ